MDTPARPTSEQLIAAVILMGTMLAGVAAADVVVLRKGDLVTGEVVATAPDSLTILIDGGARVTYDATEIEPRSFVNLRAADLDDSATEHLMALADFAALSALFREARGLLGRAEGGLSAVDPNAPADHLEERAATLARIEVRRQELRELEAAWLVERAREKQTEGELARALEMTKDVLTDFPETQSAQPAKALADEILAAQRAEAEAEARAAEEAVAEEGSRARNRRFEKAEKVMAKARDLLARGVADSDRALEFVDQGNRAKMRRHLGASEKYLLTARAYFEEIPEILRGQPARAGSELTPAGDLLKEADESIVRAEDGLVELFARVARAYVDERNFKSAQELVQKGMSLRPNDKRLRSLDEEIAEKWIRRSAAKRANVGPRVKRRGP